VAGTVNVGALEGNLTWDDTATGVLQRFQRVLDQTAQRINNFTDNADKLGYRLQNAGQHISRVGDRLTLLSAPLIAASAASIKMSTTFQTELTKVANITEIGSEAFTRMRGEILKLSPQVARGPVELTQALYAIGSVGLSGARALEVLEQSSKASAVGLGQTDDVARAVTAAMINYADEGLTAARATDVLFSAVKEGGAEADQFAYVLGRVIATAKQAGVSFEEVTASVATFTRLGVRADEAVTALRGTLAFLQKPSIGAQEELLKLGTSIQQVRDKVRKDGLVDALIDLVRLTKGNEDAIGRIIPNVRSLAGVLANAASQADAYRMIVDKNYKSAGLLQGAFEVLSETAGFKLQAFWARVQILAITAGDQLAPSLLRVVDAATPLLTAFTALVGMFSSLPGPIQTGTIALVAMTVALGPLLSFWGRFIELLGLVLGQRGLASLTNALGLAATALGLKTAATAADTAATGSNTAVLVANSIAQSRQVITTTALATASGILGGAFNLVGGASLVAGVRMLAMQGQMLIVGGATGILSNAMLLLSGVFTTIATSSALTGARIAATQAPMIALSTTTGIVASTMTFLSGIMTALGSTSVVMAVRMALVSAAVRAVGLASQIAGAQVAQMGVTATIVAVAKAGLATAINLVTSSATVLGVRAALVNVTIRAVGIASQIAGAQIAGMGVAATIAATAQAVFTGALNLLSSSALVMGARLAIVNVTVRAVGLASQIAGAQVASMGVVATAAAVAHSTLAAAIALVTGSSTALGIRMALTAAATTAATFATRAATVASGLLTTAITGVAGSQVLLGIRMWAASAATAAFGTAAATAATATASLSAAIGTLLGIGLVIGLLWGIYEASKKAWEGIKNMYDALTTWDWSKIFAKEDDNWARRMLGWANTAKDAAAQMVEAKRMMQEASMEALTERLSGEDIQKRIDELGNAVTKLNQKGQLVTANYRRIAAEGERIMEAAKASGQEVQLPKWLADIVGKHGSKATAQVTLGGQAPTLDTIDAQITAAERAVNNLSGSVRDKLVRALTVGKRSAKELHEELGAKSPGELVLQMLQDRANAAATAIKGTTSWVQRLKNEAGTLENEIQAGFANLIPIYGEQGAKMILWEEFENQISKISNRLPLVKQEIGSGTQEMLEFGQQLARNTFESKRAAEWQEAYNNIVEQGIKKMERYADATAKNADAMTESQERQQDLLASLQQNTLSNTLAGIQRETEKAIRNIPQAQREAGLATELVNQLLDEQATKVHVAYEKWIRGSQLTRNDLGELEKDARGRFLEMQRSGRFSAEEVRAAWLQWYELDRRFRGEFGAGWMRAFGLLGQAMNQLNLPGFWGEMTRGIGGVLTGFGNLGNAVDDFKGMLAGMRDGVKFSFEQIAGNAINLGMGIVGIFMSAFNVVNMIMDKIGNVANRRLRAELVENLGGKFTAALSAQMAGMSAAQWDKFLKNDDISKFRIEQISKQIEESKRMLQAYGLSWKDFRTDIAQLGLDDVARTLANDFRALTQAGANPEKVIKGMSGALNQLIIDAVETGTKIPRAMQPILTMLIQTGQISEQAAAALLGVADAAKPAFKDIEEAAERYGITLDSLGPKVEQIRITEVAEQIAKDFQFLTGVVAGDAGAINAVMVGMQDEIQEIVNKALTLGLTLPESMKPVLQSMIDAGLLTDQFGNAMTSLDGIDFAPTLMSKIDELITALSKLIDQMNAAGDAAERVGRIPPPGAIYDDPPRQAIPRPGPGNPAPAPPPPGSPAQPRPSPAPKPGGTDPGTGLPTDPEPAFGGNFANRGGIVRAGRLLNFPLVNARHFAFGGRIGSGSSGGSLLMFTPWGGDRVPIMARPDEIILNQAQQKNVASAIIPPIPPSASPRGPHREGPQSVTQQNHFTVEKLVVREDEDVKKIALAFAQAVKTGGEVRTIVGDEIVSIVRQRKAEIA
jgi:TP901 family phage tail tape measure protein